MEEVKSEAVIAAAAAIATTQVAVAAADATKTVAAEATIARKTVASAASEAIEMLKTAAKLATDVVMETAAKTLAEFPNIQQDIREIRQAQRDDSRNLMAQMDKVSQTVLVKFNENRVRIDALEKWRWLVIGGAIALGWVFSMFVFKLGPVITTFLGGSK